MENYKNYFITVKRGLLEPKHRIKMQVNQKTTAIWMYLWFLDRMTYVDPKTQLGIVLGGKPITLEEIDVYEDVKCRRRVFAKLKTEGYIITKRTPYGRIVWVTKAFKIFGLRVGQPVDKALFSVDNPLSDGRSKNNNAVGLDVQKRGSDGRSNKTVVVDSSNEQLLLSPSGFASKELKNGRLCPKSRDGRHDFPVPGADCRNGCGTNQNELSGRKLKSMKHVLAGI